MNFLPDNKQIYSNTFIKQKSVCHLTSVHPRNDTRIFLKQCRSLADAGYKVSLVVADGKGNEQKDGVTIYDVGKSHGRIARMTKIVRRVFNKALSLKADIYHLHDPELIPIGLKLKHIGKRVVFDSHEDVPKQLLTKHYLNKPILWFIANIFKFYEAWACRQFDSIIAATPFIRDKFLAINPLTVDINNFPILGELNTVKEWNNKQLEVCYVGGISSIRGIREIVNAMGNMKNEIRLQLCGRFSEPEVEKDVKKLKGWSNVDALGFLNRSDIKDVLAHSIAGLVTFYSLPNHVDAQPNKMFEYMSAGIPVIASNFPLWRQIIEGNNCGLCVDPLNPKAIAEAIDFLAENPEKAEQMGQNGYRAVKTKYNWTIEEKKLFNIYRLILCSIS